MVTRATAALLAGASARFEDFPVAHAWAPDGARLAIGGGQGRIDLVDARDGKLTSLGEHLPGVLDLAWQPKGMLLASSGQDGAVLLWDTAEPGSSPRVLQQGKSWAANLAWRTDGQRMAFGRGREVPVFDAAGALQATLTGHPAAVSHLAWRGRDEVVVAGNGVLCVDRIGGASEQFVLEGTPVTLAVSPDNRIVANGLTDGTVNFRYLNSRKRSRMSGYAGKVDQTAWSASSRYLATASTGASSIVVWDFGGKGPEGSEPLQLGGHEDRISALAAQPNGPLLVSAGRDWRVCLWRPGPGARGALDIQLLDGPAESTSWSPDGRDLAVTQPDGTVRFFSISPS